MPANPAKTIRSTHLTKRQHRWISIGLIVLALNVIWWQQPIFYNHFLTQAQHWELWPLLGYSLASSISIAIMVQSHFTHRASYLFLLISMLVVFNSQLRTRFEILALLLLFSFSLILIPQNFLRLKNALGLVVFSTLATYSVPVSIYFLANNFVTQRFINQSWPMLFGFLFFFTPLFLPNAKGRVLSLVTIMAFWAALVLSQGFHVTTLIAALLALPAFLLQFNKRLFQRWQPVCSTACLALVVCLLYQ